MFPALAAAFFAATATILPAPVESAENDSFSPQIGIAVDPTLSIAPSLALGRLCFPGSTCPD